MIKDNKIKYFYKNEFKSLFFNEIKSKNKKNTTIINNYKLNQTSLFQKQLYSFIGAYINHPSIRSKIADELNRSKLLDDSSAELLSIIFRPNLLSSSFEELLKDIHDDNLVKILKKCIKSDIYQLFPYVSPKYNDKQVLQEVTESCQNLKTRLLNLQKINKSMDSFLENSSQINWEELQKINKEILDDNL